MLSAFAARKAAKSASQSELDLFQESRESPVLVPPPSVKQSKASSKSTAKAKPPSKRSRETSSSAPAKRKKTSDRNSNASRDTKTASIFVGTDGFVAQEDVIVVPSDEEEDDDEEEMMMEAERELGSPMDDSPSVGGRAAETKRRGWSPSRPLRSSPSSSSLSDGNELLGEDADMGYGMQQVKREVSERMSTYVYSPLQNAFALSPDEANAFDAHPSSTAHSKTPAAALLLLPNETLSLLGVYNLTVLGGHVTIAGSRLSPASGSHNVFAPRSAPIPSITALAPQDVAADNRLLSKLPDRVQSAVATRGGALGAVILICRLDTGIDGLGRVCRVFEGFFGPRGTEGWQEIGGTGTWIVPEPSRDVQPLVLPPSWEDSLASVCCDTGADDAMETHGEDADDSLDPDNPPVVLVRGAKKSGKSTFARTTINRLLGRYRRVAFLECDLGQSEFSPCGMVALHVVERPLLGPPFTHPSLPYRAHYIGSTSPRSSPSHYLSAIKSLVEAYSHDIRLGCIDEADDGSGRLSAIPLVVNTMGWTKGLGAMLNHAVSDILSPTAVCVVGDGGEDAAPAPAFNLGLYEQDRTGFGMFSGSMSQSWGSQREPRIHTLTPVSGDASAAYYNAVDQRNLALLSYFHAVFPPSSSPAILGQVTAQAWQTTLPLCAFTPYAVDWTQAIDRVVLTGAGSEDVVPNEIERVMNGAVVGLVACEPNSLDALDIDAADPDHADGPSNRSNPVMPYAQGGPPPDPMSSTCTGLALVRAVAPNAPIMHILTPVPPHAPAASAADHRIAALVSDSVLHDATPRVLVKGELELPVWGMLDFRAGAEGSVAGVERNRVPFLKWGRGEGVGGERRRVRRNLMRRGQV